MRRIIAFLLAVMCFALPCTADQNDEAENPDLAYFWFSCGGYLPTESYEIVQADGVYTLTRDDGASAQMERYVVDQLLTIIGEYDLYSWDGFHGDNPGVLDGEMFSLTFTLRDGTSIEATGDNSFPANYHVATAEIKKLLDTALDGIPSGLYQYEDEGFGGDFTITFSSDGTYTFCEGALSSYMGGGRWFAERKLVYLNEENGFDLHFCFQLSEDALIFIEELSDQFPYVKVPDGGRFVKTEVITSANALLLVKGESGTSLSAILSGKGAVDECLKLLQSDGVAEMVLNELQRKYPDLTVEFIQDSAVIAILEDSRLISITTKTNNSKLTYDLCMAYLNLMPAIADMMTADASYTIFETPITP